MARSSRLAGRNCILSAEGYGVRRVRALQVAHGMSVVANNDTTRNARAFYPWKRTSGSFGIVLVFWPHSDYEDFALWIMGYGRLLTNPYGSSVSPMRVQIPSRRFEKIGVPTGERGPVAVFGDDVRSTTYTVTVNFEGASDPVDLRSDLVSSFERAERQDETSRYFYPAGVQLSAAESTEDRLYAPRPWVHDQEDGMRGGR